MTDQPWTEEQSSAETVKEAFSKDYDDAWNVYHASRTQASKLRDEAEESYKKTLRKAWDVYELTCRKADAVYTEALRYLSSTIKPKPLVPSPIETGIITFQWLQQQRASADDLSIFVREFGQSVELSHQTLQHAVEIGLRASWLAGNMLEEESRSSLLETEQEAFQAHRQAIHEYWQTYDRLREKNLAEYKKKAAESLQTLECVIADALWQRICKQKEEGS